MDKRCISSRKWQQFFFDVSFQSKTTSHGYRDKTIRSAPWAKGSYPPLHKVSEYEITSSLWPAGLPFELRFPRFKSPNPATGEGKSCRGHAIQPARFGELGYIYKVLAWAHCRSIFLVFLHPFFNQILPIKRWFFSTSRMVNVIWDSQS